MSMRDRRRTCVPHDATSSCFAFTLTLQVMTENNLKKLVFSSSCTVYGEPQFLPVTEDHPIGDCINPYGASKYFAEIILKVNLL